MRVAAVTILASSNAANDQVSSNQTLAQDYGCSVSATFTGSPAGTLTLEGSVDGTNYVTISDSSVTVSELGTTIWNIGLANYPNVRCRWVHTAGSSGTVTMSCYVRGN